MANERARQLRKNQTVAEKRLWNELRELRWQGYHFRRQAPIDKYIVDFACYAQRMAFNMKRRRRAGQTPRETLIFNGAGSRSCAFATATFRSRWKV